MSVEEEIAFLDTTYNLQKNFLDAKADKENNYELYASTKSTWSQYRMYWRQIREYIQAGGVPPEGDN